MKASLRTVDDHGIHYQALMFWCPGCEKIDDDGDMQGGLHMLPVNTNGVKAPSWDWDGNIAEPTLSPSILSRRGHTENDARPPFVCHSFIKAGMIEFLGDCTHKLAGQTVPLGELPDWVSEEV